MIKFADGTIDDRTVEEVSAEVWSCVFNCLDECEDIDADTAGRIAQATANLTKKALIANDCRRRV